MPIGTTARSPASYPGLAATCDCADNRGFVNYLVNLVKQRPALWGYYVADEPPTANEAAVRAFSQQVHAADTRITPAGFGNADVALIEPFADDAEVSGWMLSDSDHADFAGSASMWSGSSP